MTFRCALNSHPMSRPKPKHEHASYVTSCCSRNRRPRFPSYSRSQRTTCFRRPLPLTTAEAAVRSGAGYARFQTSCQMPFQEFVSRPGRFRNSAEAPLRSRPKERGHQRCGPIHRKHDVSTHHIRLSKSWVEAPPPAYLNPDPTVAKPFQRRFRRPRTSLEAGAPPLM